ncbi:MAG: hypothetical protein CMD66_08270 [Gammaproteobacteria bacterium]|nr:hypothetical protein [Gammaproteobacteria bacterium]|tara:strand:+ start:1756 stop:2286 length:531 start_codon:yes stop_codon:yes gene_type:complete
MKKICFILIVAVSLAGCATSLDGERYRSVGPSFDLFEFFNGTVRAWGLVQNRGGEVVQKFEVDIRGTVTGNRITLDETFRYAIGTGPTKRVWKVDRLDNGEYRGVADDVLGEATGSVYGNAFRWSYRMEIPVGNTLYEVSFEDWFWAIDDRRLLNRSYIQKFRFDMAEVTIFMERQ